MQLILTYRPNYVISLFTISRVGGTVSYCQVTPTEPSVVERAVRRRHSGISILWMLATAPIADTYAIDSLGLAYRCRTVTETGAITVDYH